MAWLQVNFHSNALLGSTTLNILIPAETMPGFPPRPRSDWKTVYLLHGLTGDASDWLVNTQLQELSQASDTVFVMPSGRNSFYLDGASSSEAYSTFVGRELVEFTRKILPLSTKREETILAGLSMGGYGAIYNGLRWHETFGHTIGLSAALVMDTARNATDAPDGLGLNRAFYEQTFGDLARLTESDRNPAVLAERIMQSDTAPVDLYFACGWNDMLVHENRTFKKALDKLGFSYTYEEGPGTHDWAFWTTYLRRGLERIAPIPAMDMSFFPFWIEKPEGDD
jgi:S-formylglutathione hydrolase FrmB